MGAVGSVVKTVGSVVEGGALDGMDAVVSAGSFPQADKSKSRHKHNPKVKQRIRFFIKSPPLIGLYE